MYIYNVYFSIFHLFWILISGNFEQNFRLFSDGLKRTCAHNVSGVRLRGDEGDSGVVQVKYHRSWITICDDNSDKTAHVMCRNMGYHRYRKNKVSPRLSVLTTVMSSTSGPPLIS